MNKEENNRLKINLTFLLTIGRILFGLLFLISAYTKLIDLPEFQKAIVKFAIIPDSFSVIISYSIPLIEVLLGLQLIFNFFVIVNLQLSIYLLTLFTSVIIIKLLEGGDEISCGCFGALSSGTIDFYTVLRNIILLIWALLILFFKIKENEKIKSSGIHLKNKFIAIIATSSFILLLTLTIALAIRNFELKNRIYVLIEENNLNKGDLVNPFDTFKLDGSVENINYCDFRKTILFIMKYGCKTCVNNTKVWNDIFERFNCDSILILGVSVDNIATTKKLLNEYKPKFPIVFNSTNEFNENFKLFQLPVTIIINSEGRIDNIWKGFINSNLIELLDKKLINIQKERINL